MESAAKIVKPKLSQSTEAGTNALNTYHLVGQLLALYCMIEKLQLQEEVREKWEMPSQSLLLNIGQVYEVWNSIKDQGNYGISATESPALRQKIFGFSNRIDQIQRTINDWTSASKLPSLLMKCEMRWQRVIQNFIDCNDTCTITVASILSDSRERHRMMQELWRFYKAEKESYGFAASDKDTDISEFLLGDLKKSS